MKHTLFYHITNPKTLFNQIKLHYAAHLIKKGKLVVFPTETVYGLGADALNDLASKKIYEAKGRPSDNPLIIHIADPKDATLYTETNTVYEALAKAFMPGPLTIVLKAKDVVPLSVRANLPTVAVRCPVNPIARELIRLSKTPIAAPSANLSGKPSPTCFDHVMEDMNHRVDLIIDGGPCDIGVESTIVKIENEDTITLLRPGKITVEELSSIVPHVQIANAVLEQLKDGEVVLSPGMKYKHYAPQTPFILLQGTLEEQLAYLQKQHENYAYLVFDDVRSMFDSLGDEHLFSFGSSENYLEQTHLLFYQLREIDKYHFDCIYASLPKQEGVGLALFNRMIRAAAHQIKEL